MSEGHVPTPAADESLFALLAARARRATDGQLVASAIGGLVVSVAIALLLPGWWPLAMPPIVVDPREHDVKILGKVIGLLRGF